MELLRLVKLVIRHWFIVTLSISAGVMGALLLLQTIDPLYVASTTFAVTVRSEQFDSDDQTRLINTYTQLITSQPVLDTVRMNLRLNTNLRALEKQITVKNSQDTLLVEVAVKDTNPQQAALIANELVTVLVQQGRQLLGNDRIAGRATIQLIEVAQPDSRPISPSRVRIILFAVVLTTTLAIGGLWLREQLDTTVYSCDQVEALAGIDMLVAVPHNPRQRTNTALITLNNPVSPVAEAYRLLREQIDYLAQNTSIRSLAVVSGNEKEGKSTVAANLAVIMAQAGIRVILIDADLRCPTLHLLFQQPASVGLTEVLEQLTGHTSNGHIDLAPINTPIPGIQLLTSGTPPTNPAELLRSPAMTQLVERLHEQADIVIFDTSPLLTAVDALVVGRLCDATLLVVRAGKTQQQELLRICQQLQSFAIHPLGVVLNDATSTHANFDSPTYYRRASSTTPTAKQRAGRQPVSEQVIPEQDSSERTTAVTLEPDAYA
jgi:capsular exopolysaccharide synthesis family protein